MTEENQKDQQGVGGNAEQYMEQYREAMDNSESAAPYGAWYMERVREANGEAAAQSPKETFAAEPLSPDKGHIVDTTVEVDQGGSDVLEARGELVTLSGEMEQQLARNARELGVVEGSLLGTGERPQVIGFTSCFDGEGKTTTALNAAYGIGQTGSERVLLVDANPVRPRLQQLFSVHSGPGLGEVLLGTVPVEDALHPTKYKGLEVLAAGSGWSAFGHSLPTVRLKAFLDIVRAAYDCIIIDSTSLFTASDAMLAAPLMDGVVITVACEHTKWEAVQAAAEKVRGAGGRVLGVALNRRKYYIPKKVYQWLSG